jgi:hypothetical protein
MNQCKYLQTTVLKDVVAIDGKTLCNRIDELNNVTAIHMVSAFPRQPGWF